MTLLGELSKAIFIKVMPPLHSQSHWAGVHAALTASGGSGRWEAAAAAAAVVVVLKQHRKWLHMLPLYYAAFSLDGVWSWKMCSADTRASEKEGKRKQEQPCPATKLVEGQRAVEGGDQPRRQLCNKYCSYVMKKKMYLIICCSVSGSNKFCPLTPSVFKSLFKSYYLHTTVINSH